MIFDFGCIGLIVLVGDIVVYVVLVVVLVEDLVWCWVMGLVVCEVSVVFDWGSVL